MSLKTEKDKTKQLQDKCQSVLNSLLRDEDNKYCVDCDSKGPRWASWNIGVFLCIRCAGIHRNLGVHISKVKSVNLDTWTPEQVVSLQQMGNSRARAVYEANLPDNFRRPQNDSSLESFIRAKYEHKKYIAREWVPLPLPKVNWEKEIDDELDKQKRKKKTILEKKPLSNVEVPQLPKPTNPSPKPLRSANNTPETKEKSKSKSNSSDLLGMNGEDSFSSFISASPAQTTPNPNLTLENSYKKEESVNTEKSEEESFFNQTLPVEKEKVKMDKNSILALYGSAPTIPQFQNPMQVQFPTGAFQTAPAPQQANFSAFGSFSHTGTQFPMQNGQFLQQQTNGGFQNWAKTGSVQFPSTQQQQQFVPQNQFQPQQPNQFQNGHQPVIATNAQFTAVFPPTQQIPLNQSQFGTTTGSLGNVNFASTLPGNAAFFSNPSLSMQQQFGNLTLGSATTAQQPNVGAHTWQ